MTPSRRAFTAGLFAIGALGPLASGAAAAAPQAAAAPVVAFHLDGLYLDWTGAAEAYRPPAGLRSLAFAETLSDAELQALQGWP
jgi:hypothetical protein